MVEDMLVENVHTYRCRRRRRRRMGGGQRVNRTVEKRVPSQDQRKREL